ncbi:MAG TPA: neutral zinc metallopeptidase [Thermoanaerobaculia bacterium]|nr:neutral zinc metallopeptidase [Thermoanaerobaculia bacterium]
MRWEGRRTSGNVEDRRGMSRGLVIGGGGGLATLVVLAIAMFTGIDPRQLLQGAPSAEVGQQQGGAPPANDPQAQFVSVILADTEDTWHQVLPQAGRQYEDPKLVLFSDAVASACGQASSAVGPFYCSRDSTVYLDMSFFNELEQRFGAPGDFARAYVIAHEVGHHVQNLLGISSQVEEQQARSGEEGANALSVRLELQADCFAGVWGAHAKQERDFLESGDIEEALNAASAIGDDKLQEQAKGYVVPESFTHGSSAQRAEWFRRGLESGDPHSCDTFGAR